MCLVVAPSGSPVGIRSVLTIEAGLKTLLVAVFPSLSHSPISDYLMSQLLALEPLLQSLLLAEAKIKQHSFLCSGQSITYPYFLQES
jgi:hypothetical protein